MTQLSWNQMGERYFETGVDHGVLYPVNANGVVWNGLTSVEESPSGGDSVPYYVDGIKYLNLVSPEEFIGTINAFTYPDEFYECDGTAFDSPGFGIEQQSRKSFGLCYRTKLGNDVNGQSYGYKLHIIYNAIASPSNKSNKSTTDSVDAIGFSWGITTIPILVLGRNPFSSIVIDSTKTDPDLLAMIEDILYGTLDIEPRLPLVEELSPLFKHWVPKDKLKVIDNGDGSFTVTGPDEAFSFPSSTEFAITWVSAVFIDTDSYYLSNN